jgi:collagenase-like PrtC family protease
MRLTLGPILFNWDPAVWRDFDFRIADEADIDTVCIGEVVCSKRWPYFEEHAPNVIDRLARSGKEVVVSSLALITLGRERKQTASLAQQADVPVEANDITTLLHLAGRPHIVGPFVNIYNEATLAWLASKGAYRVCQPPELPLASIAAMAKARTGIDLEVWAFGRVPLAISVRCYHARLHKLTKDNCRFVCEKDPDGLVVDTLDDQRFLTINGVQTLSASYASVVTDLPALAEAGVASLRLSPQTCDMVAVARVFRNAAEGHLDPKEADATLEGICGPVSFSNGFLHGSGTPGYGRVRSNVTL